MANLPFATIDSHARALGKPSMSQHDRDLVLAMYAVLLATLVNAGAADAKAQKLRLSPEYIAHLC